jgi:hypothetical protein
MLTSITMGLFSPLALATIIALAVALAGIFINAHKRKKLYFGYGEIADDARRLARHLDAEVFRDGEDLVISGGADGFPTVVRFSHSETTPGVNLRVHAPVSFALSVVPKGERASEGRVAVRTGNEVFDNRFVTRSDQPAEARMFLSDKKGMSNLEQVCCSSRTFFTFSRGVLEQSELTIPETDVGQHVLDHVRSMYEIAKILRKMPGADMIDVPAIPREQTSLVTRFAMAAGIVAALFLVVVAARSPHQDSADKSDLQLQTDANGVLPPDVLHIPGLEEWRTAKLEEFSPDFVSWERGYGVDAASHLTGNFSKQESMRDSVYMLVKGTERRIVVLVGTHDSYDAVYEHLAGMARVPKENLPDVDWKTKPQTAPESDGLLLVSDAADPASATIIFLIGNQVVSGVPRDYRNVPLR